MLIKYVCHSRRVCSIAKEYGWLPGARYTNLRDVRNEEVGFLDIDWKKYNFKRHLEAAKKVYPALTVAEDVIDINNINRTLDHAYELEKYCKSVIIVPKDIEFSDRLDELIPSGFLIGYSVPTKYGGTTLPLDCFGKRPIHLLGGRPDIQRQLAETLNVVSIDTNRFTLDARFGDYFDGKRFIPHPEGGYDTCIRQSLTNINNIWSNYNSFSGEGLAA
jgi:hypothetical protein